MKTLPRSSSGLVRGFRAPVQQAVKEKKKKKGKKLGMGAVEDSVLCIPVLPV